MENTIKVGDFGLVTALSNFSDDAVEDKTKDTNSSILTSNVGTQLYMSPEQVSIVVLVAV